MKKKADINFQVVLLILALIVAGIVIFFLTIGRNVFKAILGFDIP